MIPPAIILRKRFDMRKILIHILIFSSLALSACSIYRVPIHQGNILDEKDVAKLEVGMSKRQVNFVMGTALLRDAFHSDRWDYINTVREDGKETVIQRLTLHFDNDTLVKIDDSALAPVTLKR